MVSAVAAEVEDIKTACTVMGQADLGREGPKGALGGKQGGLALFHCSLSLNFLFHKMREFVVSFCLGQGRTLKVTEY